MDRLDGANDVLGELVGLLHMLDDPAAFEGLVDALAEVRAALAQERALQADEDRQRKRSQRGVQVDEEDAPLLVLVVAPRRVARHPSRLQLRAVVHGPPELPLLAERRIGRRAGEIDLRVDQALVVVVA